MAARPTPRGRRPMAEAPPAARGVVLVRRERCKGCEYCVAFCPTGCLEFSPGFNAKGFHYPVLVRDGCVECGLCTALCPEYAIRTVARRRAE
jgi:2-oxoglutarate ferredoxin oxidoreductase subunit delta